MAITVCKFSKFFWGACHSDPLESFLVHKLLKINTAENTALEKLTKIGAPPSENFSEYAPDMNHFQKAYSHSFSGLSVFVFS